MRLLLQIILLSSLSLVTVTVTTASPPAAAKALVLRLFIAVDRAALANLFQDDVGRMRAYVHRRVFNVNSLLTDVDLYLQLVAVQLWHDMPPRGTADFEDYSFRLIYHLLKASDFDFFQMWSGEQSLPPVKATNLVFAHYNEYCSSMAVGLLPLIPVPDQRYTDKMVDHLILHMLLHNMGLVDKITPGCPCPKGDCVTVMASESLSFPNRTCTREFLHRALAQRPCSRRPVNATQSAMAVCRNSVVESTPDGVREECDCVLQDTSCRECCDANVCHILHHKPHCVSPPPLRPATKAPLVTQPPSTTTPHSAVTTATTRTTTTEPSTNGLPQTTPTVARPSPVSVPEAESTTEKVSEEVPEEWEETMDADAAPARNQSVNRTVIVSSVAVVTLALVVGILIVTVAAVRRKSKRRMLLGSTRRQSSLPLTGKGFVPETPTVFADTSADRRKKARRRTSTPLVSRQDSPNDSGVFG